MSYADVEGINDPNYTPPTLDDREPEYPPGYLHNAMCLVRARILNWQARQETTNDRTDS